MKINKAYLLEILIIILLFSGLFGAIYAAYYNLHYKKNIYELNFDDVDGIIKGSPVKFMGVIVGHVSELKYQDEKILVQIYITKKDTEIPNCSVAKVEFSGIVGSKSIELFPPDENKWCDGIVSNNPLRINEFFNSIEIYNRALEGMENGLKKFSNENTDFVLSKISKNPDFTSLDNALENYIKFQSEFNQTIKNVVKGEKNILNNIEDLGKKFNK